MLQGPVKGTSHLQYTITILMLGNITGNFKGICHFSHELCTGNIMWERGNGERNLERDVYGRGNFLFVAFSLF